MVNDYPEPSVCPRDIPFGKSNKQFRLVIHH